jgi:hypothetical protein
MEEKIPQLPALLSVQMAL